MNDERLQSMLASLRNERMDRIADDRTRARLETAWTARMAQRSFGSRLRRLAPVLATLVLIAGLFGATMNSSGDSALYGLRVAIEDAAVVLHQDPEDRAEYLLSLLDQRQAEAARLEQTGNAAAASRLREIEQNTLRIVRGMLPEVPEVEAPAPTATPTETATTSPAPTVTPSSTPVPTASATATPRPPTPRPTATPTHTPTPTPVRTATPTAAPTGTPFPVTATGIVKKPDGTKAAGACVLTSTTATSCATTTAADGTYRVTFSAKLNQTFTLYFKLQDGTILYKGSASATVKGATVTMPTVTLQKQ